MEQYIQGQSRDLVDQAYIKFIGMMFATLDKIAQTDPKDADIIRLENYASFQNSNLNGFSSLLEGIEDLVYTITPEEIPFQLGLSKMELRKVDKHIGAIYKKLQKILTSEELLPSLWDKCKKEFLDKYDSFAQLVAKIYPSERIPSVTEMRDILATM